jgi:hypothetical protein
MSGGRPIARLDHDDPIQKMLTEVDSWLTESTILPAERPFNHPGPRVLHRCGAVRPNGNRGCGTAKQNDVEGRALHVDDYAVAPAFDVI